MKMKLTALSLAAATAFAFTPKPAVAGDKTLAVVGGVVGGLIIGSAIANHNDSHTIVVRDDHCHDGYWKTVSVNVWVPGYWVVDRRHGHSHRRWVEGRYECRNDRVWVSHGHRGGPHRHVGHGYGRDHRRDRDDRHDRRGHR